MRPLFDALEAGGATIVPLAEAGQAPILVVSSTLNGGVISLPGNISSQFITGMLLVAPFSENPLELKVTGEILSASYIRQTLWAMERAGITLSYGQDLSSITVYPGCYRAIDTTIRGDFTSLSYLIAASALVKGTTVVQNVSAASLQGEREIISIARAIGLDLTFDEDEQTLMIVNDGEEVLCGHYRFNAKDCPNIIPTLAAIGTFVKGTFTVEGGSITRLHKSPRILAMVTELRKLGVDIEALCKDEVLDGFTVRGTGALPKGGVDLDSWGDHRIFMSLHIVSARCREPNQLPGANSVICSFPDFIEAVDRIVR
jgi:3-phosphoshikimate 1-carboxyvinyltransferase